MPGWDAERERIEVGDVVIEAPAALGEARLAELVAAAAALEGALGLRPRLADRPEAVRRYRLRPEGWWGRVTARAGLRPDGEDRWADDLAAVRVSGEWLTGCTIRTGWQTPYTYGPSDLPRVSAPVGALPDDEGGAVAALLALLGCARLAALPDVAAPDPPRPPAGTVW